MTGPGFGLITHRANYEHIALVLVISRYDGPEGSAHHYIHWPRERFCWFKDEPQ